MAPIHAADARREAVAFAVVGALQLLGAAAIVTTAGAGAVPPFFGSTATPGVAQRPENEGRAARWAMAATVALGVAAAAAWAWSRRRVLPFGLGGPEDAGLVDGLTAGFELAALAAALAGRWTSRVSWRALAPLHLLAAVATAATLAAPSTAEHGGHAHGVTADAGCTTDGHTHADDPAAGPGAGSGGQATGSGATATDPGAASGDDATDAGARAGGSGATAGGEATAGRSVSVGAAGDRCAAEACPEAGSGAPPVTDPPLDFPGERLPADRAAALHALAASSPPLTCGAAASTSHAHGSDDGATTRLAAEDQVRFDAQWAAASAAAATFATPELAAAAGYVQASPQNPGVGTHWIDWTLVDAPFDPAHPSMLLFDERPGRPARLAGFSYWTRSSPGAPDGFAGPNDVWHRHAGLCFVEGWLFQEGVPSADRCAGDWLAGTDLWMLHAWVVPELPNPAGPFAGRHEALCPGSVERVADALTCDPAGN